MPNEVAIPSVLDQLDARLRNEDASAQDLSQVLRALQRLGLPKQDIEVHIERARAVNDVTAVSTVFERNALCALDLVVGEGGDMSLSWDAQEIARIYVPRVVTQELLRENLHHALAPSDMLPPRPEESVPDLVLKRAVDEIVLAQLHYDYAPLPADFFRVPKDAFTSRPAAVLAMADRVVLEALVRGFEAELADLLPEEVLYPRNRGGVPDVSNFRRVPLQWDRSYVIKADVERFFESVDHSLLAMILASSVGATSNETQALESFLSSVMGRPYGLPQGPRASDILGSAYLLLIDVRLRDEGWTFARFADDYFIGADSMADGRAKIERLESYLAEHHLHLSGPKTRVMRRETYEHALDSGPPAILEIKRRLRTRIEAHLLESADSDEIAEVLGAAAEDDQLLWDVLYHRTTSLVEAIERLGPLLDPDTETLYLGYLQELADQLQSNRLPDDMTAAEQLARESVTYMAASKNADAASGVARLIAWFPSLGPVAAAYFLALADADPGAVDEHLARIIGSTEFPDWTRANLCRAIRDRTAPPSERIRELLESVAMDSDAGILTRASAAWALAQHNSLTRPVFEKLYEEASEPLRGDLRFVAISAPQRYPWSGLSEAPQLTQGEPGASTE